MGLFDHPYFGPLDPQVDSSIAQLVSRGGSGGGGSGGGGNAPGCAWLVDEQGAGHARVVLGGKVWR